MNQLFVSYELALRLRNLGFNEYCFSNYNDDNSLFEFWEESDPDGTIIKNSERNNDITAPMYQQVVDWLRDTYKIMIHVEKVINSDNYYPVINNVSHKHNQALWDDTYYGAMEKGILDAMKLKYDESHSNEIPV